MHRVLFLSLHISMDRISGFEPEDVGSIPTGGTTIYVGSQPKADPPRAVYALGVVRINILF